MIRFFRNSQASKPGKRFRIFCPLIGPGGNHRHVAGEFPLHAHMGSGSPDQRMKEKEAANNIAHSGP
jgi:hypothetical protein